MGWRRLGVYLLKRLTRLPGTPHHIAAGFAAGAAMSFTPFVGIHSLLSILLACLIRGNWLAALVGTVVGNPWTFPFIWLATYKLGQFMLGSGDAAPWPAVTMFRHAAGDMANMLWLTCTGDFSWSALREVIGDLRALIWPMTIGSIPLAVIGGFASYFPILRLVSAYQHARQRRRARRAKLRAEAPAIARSAPQNGAVG